ncbi:MAG: ABC transporter substrate-binding protein, partial [Bacteroidia bacterium]
MKKIFFFFLFIIAVSCGNPSSGTHQKMEAKGGKVYGGTLKINETDKYVSLYPPSIVDVVSMDIASQMYEGLVRFDASNIVHVLPAIADSWEVDATGTVYTFKLKKGVKFHDDACFSDGKGREVKSSDFKYSFQLICTANEDNQFFKSSFKGKVKGADAYYENSKSGKPGDLEGVKVIDDYTLQLTLTSPASSFLYILAGPAGYVMPKEAIEKYGNKSVVGTGPFKMGSMDADKVILVRNPFYYRTDSLGNQLPFLDSVVVSFILDNTQELDAFKKGDIHMIFGLPSAEVSKMVEAQIADFKSKTPKYILSRTSEMTTQYYQFNVVRPPFNNVKVRQAFSYAVDRDKIISD